MAIFLFGFHSSSQLSTCCGCWVCPSSGFNTPFLTPLYKHLAPQVFGGGGGRRNESPIFVLLNLLQLKYFFHWLNHLHWIPVTFYEAHLTPKKLIYPHHIPKWKWELPHTPSCSLVFQFLRLETQKQVPGSPPCRHYQLLYEVLGASGSRRLLGFRKWKATTTSLPSTREASHHECGLSSGWCSQPSSCVPQTKSGSSGGEEKEH